MTTQIRTVRVDEDLWSEALAITEARDETVSNIVRAALRRYVQRHRGEVEGETR